MKKKEKIIMGSIIAIVCIVLLIIGIVYKPFDKKKKPVTTPTPTATPAAGKNYTSTPTGELVNHSVALTEVKNYEGFKLENITLKQYKGEAVLEADCTNETGTDQGELKLAITMVSEEGKLGNQITFYIQPMKAGETTHLYTATNKNIIDAYDFVIRKTY